MRIMFLISRLELIEDEKSFSVSSSQGSTDDCPMGLESSSSPGLADKSLGSGFRKNVFEENLPRLLNWFRVVDREKSES
jgi:hypothetical protein